MIHATSLGAFCLYFTLIVLYLVQILSQRKAVALARGVKVVLYAAICLHSVLMGSVLRRYGLTIFESGADLVLWMSWLVALVFSVSKQIRSSAIVGLIVVPLVVAFLGSSSYVMHGDVPNAPIDFSERGIVSLSHSLPVLIVLTSFALLFIGSVVFILVERRLRKKNHPYIDSNSINLQYLDNVNKYLALIGFVGLSLVIASGGMWAVTQHKSLAFQDPSALTGCVVWILLAISLHFRMVRGWSPRKLAQYTVVVAGGFIVSVVVILLVTGKITHSGLNV